MISYANKDFYTTQYLCGKEAVINTASFDFYARQATQEIKKFAGWNIDEADIPEAVKFCCCELAEMIFNAEKQQNQSAGKASETVGSWSVSYSDQSVNLQSCKDKTKEIVFKWLTGTGLLYAGVRICKWAGLMKRT